MPKVRIINSPEEAEDLTSSTLLIWPEQRRPSPQEAAEYVAERTARALNEGQDVYILTNCYLLAEIVGELGRLFDADTEGYTEKLMERFSRVYNKVYDIVVSLDLENPKEVIKERFVMAFPNLKGLLK